MPRTYKRNTFVCACLRRFSLAPRTFASCTLPHSTVMLVVGCVRRPKPRFCQVLVSGSSFGAHLGVCKNESGSVITRASSTRGVKCHEENAANMTRIWWIHQGLTKIPYSNGKQRWENKQNSQRPSKLVIISAGFSRCIYFAEHLCKVLWSQDAIWRREIQFNWVSETSMQARCTL